MIALAVAEVAVRALGVAPVSTPVDVASLELVDDRALGYALRPGAPDGWGGRISSAGLRDRERAVRKPEGVLRIAVLGDSVVYGLGVAQADTFSSRLEALLNAEAAPGEPSYEVLNFGVTGYDVGRVAARLEAVALPFGPDLVVYGYCLNDPLDASHEEISLERGLRARSRSPAATWLEGSHAIRWLRWRLASSERVPGPGSASPPPYPREWREPLGRQERYFFDLHWNAAHRLRLEEGLSRVRALSERAGAPVLLVLFPLLVDGPDYPVAMVHAYVSGLARERGLAVFDLAPPFRTAGGGAELGLDILHPTARGHYVAARAVAAELRERWRAQSKTITPRAFKPFSRSSMAWGASSIE